MKKFHIKKSEKHIFSSVSPWIIAGIFMVLMPIFILMTMDTIKDQRQQVIEKLTGRGIFLLRSFEAGARTGIIGFRWKAGNVQKLLYETALQPGVAYLMITSENGKILADSDPSKTGTIYKNMPDLKGMNQNTPVQHRIVVSDAGKKIFEVFKKFTPARRGCGMERTIDLRQRRITRNGHRTVYEEKDTDWCRMHFFAFRHKKGQNPDVQQKQFIFAGLKMDRVEAMQKRFLRHSIGMGIVFFLIGCGGIVTLFIFQAYRTAKSSLSKVTAFSDRVVETMPAGLVTLNNDFDVTLSNKSAWLILDAWTDNDKDKMSLVIPDEMIDLAHEMKTVKKNITREIECVSRSMEIVLLDINASPVIGDSGEISGFLFLFRDLTELRKLEKEVERTRRLAAVGKLAAGVAHEIRNPLSSIKGFATYFKERYKNTPNDLKTAEIMINEVERLNRSVSQLLEFAKSVPISKKKVNLYELLSHSIQLVQNDLDKKKIKAVVEIKTKNDGFTTDPDRINQILLNLYLNAIHAMDNGGILSLQACGSEDNNHFFIKVKDTGIGIDKNDMDHIFDPYFTTKPEGTGLGLAMVHSAVEALDGSIRVESRKGEGTVISMKFPG